MNHVTRYAARAGAVAAAVILIGSSTWATERGLGRAGGYGTPFAGNRIVYGERQAFNGATAFTWARTNVFGQVQEVGVSIPRSLIWNPRHGHGPLGAFVSLEFPDVVKDSTFFNHFEGHWEPSGHPPNAFATPHFDLHFYGIPESDVWNIVPPDTRVPDANQVPPGYVYPGVNDAVPQMGVHATNPADLTRPFTAAMVFGYWGGNMTFIEPMVTREYLMRRPNFALSVPRPQYLYRATQYPSVFRSHFNQRSQSYEFTFTGFSGISAPPVG